MVPILGKNLCLDLMTYFVLAHPVLEGAAVILKLLLNHQSTYTRVYNIWSGSKSVVLGLVVLIDAKGIDVVQPIWS